MRSRDKDHGLYAVVFGAAILLALVLAWHGLKRMGKDPMTWRPSIMKGSRADKRDGMDRAPGELPPLSLVGGTAVTSGTRRRTQPPATPLPPITPDIEGP